MSDAELELMEFNIKQLQKGATALRVSREHYLFLVSQITALKAELDNYKRDYVRGLRKTGAKMLKESWP